VIDRPLALALAALGFFLPFSSAGVAVSMLVLLLLALALAPRIWSLQPWREPVMAAGLALLAFIALHTLYRTGFNAAAFSGVNKYQELLLAPLLYALFRLAPGNRSFWRGLLLGTLLLAAAEWAALFSPHLFALMNSRRISAGFAIAVTAFLLFAHAPSEGRPWLARTGAAFLALTVLFAIEGRTGHLLVLALVACAAWIHSPRRWRWAAVIAVPAAVLAIALSSTAVQTRVKETLAASAPASGAAPATSTSLRIEMLHVAADLARRHGLSGAGFANYGAINEEAARARSVARGDGRTDWIATNNPHSEYLMQLIAGGIASLALFLAWFGLSVRQASRAPCWPACAWPSPSVACSIPC
jgi:O-antigen ligase